MNLKKIAAAALSAMLAVNAAAFTAFADKVTEYQTKDGKRVEAIGKYVNWDGVTTVCQFVGINGEFSFAYADGKDITVVNTKGGKPLKKRIKLKMQHDIFGTVVCDKNYYYVVTGQENEGTKTSTETIFVSKYDKNGNHIKTVGDNGSSSLPYFYDSSSGHYYYIDDSCCTQLPFDAGNCDAAVNGDILTVNYGRTMYNGHQSNSVFTVTTDTMQAVLMPVSIYSSHSFGQRVVPYKKGFVYLSEGDAYNRAFTVDILPTFSFSEQNDSKEHDIFHFWFGSDSANNVFAAYSANNNYAHIGGIVNINDKKIAMVGTSVKSLNSNAKKENEQLFIQIFDPTADLSKASAYITSGTRSGKGGFSANENVTDYGVKWLTNYSSKTVISEPQIALTDKNEIVVLYEKTVLREYKGVFYTVLDENGKVLKKETRFSKTAQLNSCEMPVFANGKIWWAANDCREVDRRTVNTIANDGVFLMADDTNKIKHIYIYSLELE